MRVALSHHRRAAYDDEANPSVVEFWRNIPADHGFATHPVLRPHGEALSAAAYQYTAERVNRHPEAQGRQHPERFQQTVAAFRRIHALEANHRAALEALAVRVVAQVWGVPPEQLRPQLGQPELSDGGPTTESWELPPAPADSPGDQAALAARMRPHAQKRTTLNTLTQGAAIHGMLTMHHLARAELTAIAPDLVRLYDYVAAATLLDHWHIDYAQVVTQTGALGAANKAGEQRVDFDKDDAGQPTPVVKAAALHFPILCQELAKGAMELLTLDSLADYTPDELREIYRQSEDTAHEFWEAQVGPELWRRLLAALPAGVAPADAAHGLSQLAPERLHAVLQAVAADPAQAKRELALVFPAHTRSARRQVVAQTHVGPFTLPQDSYRNMLKSFSTPERLDLTAADIAPLRALPNFDRIESAVASHLWHEFVLALSATPAGREFYSAIRYQADRLENFRNVGEAQRHNSLAQAGDYVAYNMIVSGQIQSADAYLLVKNHRLTDRTLALVVELIGPQRALLSRARSHPNAGPQTNKALVQIDAEFVSNPLLGLTHNAVMTLAKTSADPEMHKLIIEKAGRAARMTLVEKNAHVSLDLIRQVAQHDTDDEVRADVMATLAAKDPASVEAFVSDRSEDVRLAAVGHVVNPALLAQLAQTSKDDAFLKKIALNPATPRDALNVLWANGGPNTKQLLVLNSKISGEVVGAALVTKALADMDGGVLARSDLPPYVLRAVWRNGSRDYRTLAANLATPPDVLLAIFTASDAADWRVKQACVANPNFPVAEALERPEYAKYVAGNWTATPEQIAAACFTAGDKMDQLEARDRAATNPRTGLATLYKIKHETEDTNLSQKAGLQRAYLLSRTSTAFAPLSKEDMRAKGFDKKESFDHHAFANYGREVPGYGGQTFGVNGTPWVAYLYATDPANEFPEDLFRKFNLHSIEKQSEYAGARRGVPNGNGKPLGWIGGVWDETRKTLFVTECQSDLLQRTRELATEPANYIWKGLKSRLEGRFDKWHIAFFNQAVREAKRLGATRILVPTSAAYASRVNAAGKIAERYDSIARAWNAQNMDGWHVIDMTPQIRVARLSKRSAVLYVGPATLTAREYQLWQRIVDHQNNPGLTEAELTEAVAALGNFAEQANYLAFIKTLYGPTFAQDGSQPAALLAQLNRSPQGQAFLEALEWEKFLAQPYQSMLSKERANLLADSDAYAVEHALADGVVTEDEIKYLIANIKLNDYVLAQLVPRVTTKAALAALAKHAQAGPLTKTAIADLKAKLKADPTAIMSLKKKLSAAESRNTKPELLTALARDPEAGVRRRVAKNTAAPEPALLAVLQIAAQNGVREAEMTAWNVCSNARATTAALKLAFDTSPLGAINGGIGFRAALDADLIDKIIQYAREFFEHAIESESALKQLAGSQRDPVILRRVFQLAHQAETTATAAAPHQQRRIHDGFHVLSLNEATPADVLNQLAQFDDELLRERLAAHLNMPEDTLRSMLEGAADDETRRQLLKKTLGRDGGAPLWVYDMAAREPLTDGLLNAVVNNASTPLAGLLRIEPLIFADYKESYREQFAREEFAERPDLPADWHAKLADAAVRDNDEFTLRGLANNPTVPAAIITDAVARMGDQLASYEKSVIEKALADRATPAVGQ